MKEVVVIPTFNRPEVLAHCLMKLDKALNPPDDVRIFLDNSPEKRVEEVTWVRDTYLPRALVFHAPPHQSVSSGTWNILNSIRGGYETESDWVYILEEDVLIFPRFFNVHRELRESGDYLATCGRRLQKFFERYGDLYTNPGSCLRRDLLTTLVPHINESYFAGTAPYIEKTFGRTFFNSSLDDGLIRMCIWQMGGQVKYPDTPICAHQGFDWYNEIDIYSNNEGSLEEKIARFEKITSSIKPGDRYAKDFEPFLP
jgi:hypothetical protein